MEERIPYIPLTMAHGGLSRLPEPELPLGYSFRLYRPGDEAHWAAVTVSAGEFDTLDKALAYFHSHFGGNLKKLEDRCFFLLDGNGMPVGTATGWYMDEDASVGRLHWVAIARGHQGRGLCKPLVVAAMNRMAALGHGTGMLTTQPKSWRGIKVYLDLGWKPHDDGNSEYRKGWAIVREMAGHPFLQSI